MAPGSYSVLASIQKEETKYEGLVFSTSSPTRDAFESCLLPSRTKIANRQRRLSVSVNELKVFNNKNRKCGDEKNDLLFRHEAFFRKYCPPAEFDNSCRPVCLVYCGHHLFGPDQRSLL